MKRAIPVLVLSVAGLIPVWRYEPSTASSSSSSASSEASVVTPSASSGTSGTVFSGTTISTEKGDVQVQITYVSGKITAVSMLKAPDHPQTKNAVPKLISETLSAQSADIDSVSGATITSEAYKKSLQSAIDDAAANSSSSSGSSSSSSSSSASPSASASASAASAEVVVSGSTVSTSKGDVQVQVTFEGDKITAVSMLKAPDHPQTKNAVPKLIAETLEAQSAKIDTVSGATITSDGYKESLQAAIDAKG